MECVRVGIGGVCEGGNRWSVLGWGRWSVLGWG